MEGPWWNVRRLKAALIFPECFSRLALMGCEKSPFPLIDVPLQMLRFSGELFVK